MKVDYDYSNGKEPYVDMWAENKVTGELELIRVPKRPIRKAVKLTNHKVVFKSK